MDPTCPIALRVVARTFDFGSDFCTAMDENTGFTTAPGGTVEGEVGGSRRWRPPSERPRLQGRAAGDGA